mgnify:CR=1 FL=1
MLAGGKGTRLRPLTIHTPKPIVPIFERPFLHYQLDLLKQVRADNEAALKKMQSLGLQVVSTPEATVSEFRQQAQALRTKLDGQLWTKEWRARVEQVLAGKK